MAAQKAEPDSSGPLPAMTTKWRTSHMRLPCPTSVFFVNFGFSIGCLTEEAYY
jgi:hypothetical protein